MLGYHQIMLCLRVFLRVHGYFVSLIQKIVCIVLFLEGYIEISYHIGRSSV